MSNEDHSGEPSGYRLSVTLKDRDGGPERTLTLDYRDRYLLQDQLDQFSRVRHGDRNEYRLHRFDNGHGESVAFVDMLYIRHDVSERCLAGTYPSVRRMEGAKALDP